MDHSEAQQQAQNPNQPLSTYEDLRASARGEAASLWKEADRQESALAAYYEGLQNDPRYAEGFKAELAWKKFNEVKDKITSGRQKAKEQLSTDAAVYQRQSLPMPGGEGPITQDAQKIIISQNETQRISRKLQRLRESAGAGPLRPDITTALKEEYARGLELGGTMGALCRAVLAVCDEELVDADSVVDSFRQQRHRELLERSQHAIALQDYLGTRLAEPPYPKPQSERARISGIGAEEPAARDTPQKKALFPDNRGGHVSRSTMPRPRRDEVSNQRRSSARRNKKG